MEKEKEIEGQRSKVGEYRKGKERKERNTNRGRETDNREHKRTEGKLRSK